MSADTQVFLSPNFLPLFIDAYRNHHCLWRVKCKEYSNRNIKQNAYLDLVELCKTVVPDCNVDFVKRKIDLIRGNFRREHKKVNDSKKSGAGTDSVHVPKLWYYKLLLFLSDQEEVRQSVDSLDAPDENSLQADSDAPDGNIDEHEEHEDDPEPPEDSQQKVVTPSPFGRKRKARQNENSTTDYLKQAVNILQREEDDYDKFASNVAAKLRKMDERETIYAENLINQILFQGALFKLQEDSTIFHPHPLSVNTPASSTSSTQDTRSSMGSTNFSPGLYEDSSSYNLYQFQ